MAQILIAVIRLYQQTLSFDHGWLKVFYPNGFCRFHPTCSQYAVESLAEHGFWAGSFLSFARISRCHPFTAPGLDPIPHKQAIN